MGSTINNQDAVYQTKTVELFKTHRSQDEKDLTKKCNIQFGRRHIVALHCFLGMVISYAMRFCLSIAITEMTSMPLSKEDNDTCPLPYDYNNDNVTMKETEFYWTGSQQGVVNSAFFWGYVLGQIPGGVAADKFGGRKIITFGTFFTGVFSILSPYAAKMFGWIGLAAIRICVGLSQGLFYAAVHTVVGHWIPKEERGTWGTFIFSGVHIGNALNMLFSGVFLYYTQQRWDLLFVMYGVAGVAWSLCFFFTTYDTPADHPFLSQYEKNILKTKIKSESETMIKPKKTPWRSILTSLPVWAAAVAMIGHDFGLFAMITDLPKFFKTVLHFSIKNNGFFNALTYILIWVVGIFAGVLSDYIDNNNIISVTSNRKIGTTLASFLPSLGFISSVYVGCDTALATACLLVGQAFMGFYYPSLKVNTIDLSTNFAGTVSSLVVAVGGLSGVIVPYLIGTLTPNNTISEWRIVMWIAFSVMSVTNVFYIIFASGEMQPWDNVEENTVEKSQQEGKTDCDSSTGTFKNI